MEKVENPEENNLDSPITQQKRRSRLRDLGIAIGRLKPGPLNAITDVPGTLVGHSTIIKGQSGLGVENIVRTGVTSVFPHRDIWHLPVFAGCSTLNGNGEMAGAAWIEESGLLTTPICLTNTHSLGVVRDSMISYFRDAYGIKQESWMLPVVAETWDGWLSDINGMHVKQENVYTALESAGTGPVLEGNVGGGTGMVCHEFKGGIGSSSRVLDKEYGGFFVGALVQANYGLRHQLRLNGYPIGKEIPIELIPGKNQRQSSSKHIFQEDQGSIIIIVATDAPLLPVQCRRLARRAALGLARVGSIAADSSGDLFIAFSTGNKLERNLAHTHSPTFPVTMTHSDLMTLLFEAVVEVTDEAIWNSLCMAETLSGIKGRISYALPLDNLQEIVAKHRVMAT